MSFLDSLIAIFLSVGMLQGIVFGVLFWLRKSGAPTANRLLAALLFCFAYRLGLEVMLLFNLGRYDLWYHLTLELNWAYGPLIYLFVRAWLSPNDGLRRSDWGYFLPVGVELVCSTFVRSQNFYWDGTRESLSWLGYWGYVVWMNYPFKYVIASLLILFYTRRAEAMVQARPQVQRSEWLRRLLRVVWVYFAIIIVVVLVDFVLFFDASFRTFYYYFTRFYYYPLFVGIAALTYWLGLEGYLRKGARLLPSGSALGTEQRARLEALALDLERRMREEKLYRDPAISLTGLAETLNVKSYLLSKCFKEIMHTRFTDYINRLRVQEWKRLLSIPGKDHYTLLGLAYEAGFNSKASFQRAVKKEEGVSPGELRNRLKNDSIG